MSKAATLARQYVAVTTASTPSERLTGMAALDWLVEAPADQLREILLAHLESPSIEVMLPAKISVFASALIEAWVSKDWRACEQFVWDSTLPKSIRRDLLVETFKAAALRYPDEVYTRLRTLSDEKRFLPKSLLVDGSGIQCGGDCFMGYVPQYTAAVWIKQAGAIEKLNSLPDVWQTGAISGAVRNFDNVNAGLALLNWLVDLSQNEEEQSRKGQYEREITKTFQRLAVMDLESARLWLEAKPARYAKSEDPFDNFSVVRSAMLERDPLAAAVEGNAPPLLPGARQRRSVALQGRTQMKTALTE